MEERLRVLDDFVFNLKAENRRLRRGAASLSEICLRLDRILLIRINSESQQRPKRNCVKNFGEVWSLQETSDKSLCEDVVEILSIPFKEEVRRRNDYLEGAIFH